VSNLRSIPEKERETLSQPEKVWEKSCCPSTKLAKAMIKKLSMRVRVAKDTKAALLHLLFLQGLTCFLERRVAIGLFEAAE